MDVMVDRRIGSAPRRRPGRLGTVALIWFVAHAALSLVWTVTGENFPFGTNDPEGQMSLLRGLDPGLGAPLFSALLSLGIVALWFMTNRRTAMSDRTRRWLLVGGWTLTALLLVVVPDWRVLALVGYTPAFIVGAPFGWPPVSYLDAVTWPMINQGLCLVGGYLLGRTTLAFQGRSRGACVTCGRSDKGSRLTTMALRWGRAATYLAAAIPALYALSRIAWALGIPLGVDDEFMTEMVSGDGRWASLGLGLFALTGTVLTLGLAQRWGEVFPRWVPFLAGRPVPVVLAVAPASFVSVLVTSAGLSLLSGLLGEELGELTDLGDWTVLPILFWPFWGIALGAATLAYYLRRRGRCSHCGRL